MTDSLLENAGRRAERYLAALAERRVAPDQDAVRGLSEFDVSFPQGSQEPSAVLATLDRVGSPATVATAGPRYFGYVIGGSMPVTLASTWLAAAWDQNAGYSDMSPTAIALERIALKWLLEALHLPAGSAGAFVTGATMANFNGLAAARHALLKRRGWDVEEQGLFGAPPLRVVVGQDAHVSLFKALSLLGLGRARVIRIATDDQGRMIPEALPPLDDSTILCLQAGNVDTGASDPFLPLCQAARIAGSWIHVDGAFGLWAAASDEHADQVLGVELADSWATDCHKWLNVPYDSGLAFCRDEDALRAAMASTPAAYLAGERASGEREPARYTPELSRRARGVEVWAALATLGRNGLSEMIARTCRMASRFGNELRSSGFQVLSGVVLNQVLVHLDNNDRTRRFVTALQQEGTCWCGGTEWRGKAAMRISVSSWATTERDVDRSIDAMLRCRDLVRQ
ncbi:MAG: pyridoxal-dependent decarboxylase [Gemmatimonadota bacterium]